MRHLATPSRPRPWGRHVASPLAALALCLAADAGMAQTPQGLGFELRPQSSSSDIGLPVYPGAQQRRDRGDDAPGLTLALWGGPQGFRLALLKYTSPDAVDKVAAFYREAMAAHGPVLDCTRPPPAPPKNDRQALRCDEKLEPGAVVLKVGSAEQQRIVSLKAANGRTEFEIVRLQNSF